MTVVLDVDDGGVPIRELIQLAYGACGLSDGEFDISAEEMTSAHRKLRAMVAEWPWSLLGFDRDATLEEGCGVADRWLDAVAAELAMRIAPTVVPGGVTGEHRRNAANSRALVLAAVSTPPTARIASNTPRGGGFRHRVSFIREPD